MLENAHIRSMCAALIRALGLVASARHTPRMMRVLFRVTLEHRFRLAVELFADERWI